jgi:hypothetical protein
MLSDFDQKNLIFYQILFTIQYEVTFSNINNIRTEVLYQNQVRYFYL